MFPLLYAVLDAIKVIGESVLAPSSTGEVRTFLHPPDAANLVAREPTLILPLLYIHGPSISCNVKRIITSPEPLIPITETPDSGLLTLGLWFLGAAN